MTQGDLADHAVAGQSKAQPQLRSKVPARDTQCVRLSLPRQSESDKTTDRTAFEQLPEDKRRKTVDDALRRLRQSQSRMQAADSEDGQPSTNGPPVISEELQAKIRTIGLKTFYSQSSAQTKAELAPVLEELQRVFKPA